MLKRNGRGVVGVCSIIAIVLTATADVGIANVTSSFQSMWAKVAHDLALAGCLEDRPPCPNSEDDLDNSCDIPADAGPGLHVDIAKGSVWTRLNVLSTYGNGEESLDLALTYKSLLGDTDPRIVDPTGRLGHGWRHGFELSYFLLPEEVDQVWIPDQFEWQCRPGSGPDCDEPVSNMHKEWVQTGFGHFIPTRVVPPRIVFVDGDGHQGVFYLDPIVAPAWRNMDLRIASGNGGLTGETFVLVYPDGERRYYGSNQRISRILTARGLQTKFDYDTTHSNRLTAVTDGFGRRVQFVYDVPQGWGANTGRLVEIIHPDDGAQQVRTHLHYNNATDAFLLTSIEDPLGHSTLFEYEAPFDHDDDPQTPDVDYHRMTKETLRNGLVFECDYSPIMVEGVTKQARTITAKRPASGGSFTDEQVLQLYSTMFPLHRNQKAPDADSAVEMIDGRGIQWSYQRNHWFQLKSRTVSGSQSYYEDADYATPSNGGVGEGRVATFTDSLGLQKSYAYKSLGRISAKTLAVPISSQNSATLDYITTFQYADDFPGAFPTYYQNFIGLPVWKQQPDGGIWEYEYNDKGDVTQIKDPIVESPDGIQAFVYTYFGETESVPSGMILPGRLKIVEETDRRGFKTVMTYNGSGDLVRKDQYLDIGQSQCITTEYSCDAMGRRTLETVHRGDATVATVKYEYDVLGRMTKMIENFTTSQGVDPDVFNLTTLYDYDDHGNMTSMVNPRGTRTEYQYDHRNRLIKVIEDAGQGGFGFETNYVLDGNGNVETMIDADGRATTYEYDVADFATLVTDAEGYGTYYERDTKGNATLIRRQRDLAVSTPTSWEIVQQTIYDGLSRVHSRKSGNNLPATTYDYGYGSSGGGGGGGCGCSSGFGSSIPFRISDGDYSSYPPGGPNYQGVTYNEVDLLGRVTMVVRKVGTDDGPTGDSDDSVAVYSYDPEGNMTQLTGPEGEVTAMTYDGAGRMLTRIVSAAPFDALVTSYVYDGVSNVKQITLPTTHVMLYEYDEADRLKRVYDAVGEVAFFTRDANGNVLTRADGNGNAWTYVYDVLDRMTEMRDPLVETPTDGVFKFKYDNTGNLIERENRNVNQDSQQGPIQGVKTLYVYDDIDRLTHIVEDFAIDPENPFDPEANCGSSGSQQVQDGSGEGGTQGHGVLQGGGTVTPGGGGGGPATGLEASSTPTTNTVTTYEYDGRNLVRIYDHDCNVTEYFYDPEGRVIGIDYPGTCSQCPSNAAHQVEFGYNLNTRKYFFRRDQNNYTANHYFDELGRLKQRIYTNSGIDFRNEHFDYDLSGRLTSATGTYDSNGFLANGQNTPLVSWERGYDLAGRPMLEAQTHPGSPSESYVTNVSYTLNTTDKTLSQEMCYPACGQRIVSRVWDGRGRLISANAGTDMGKDWTFDPGNRRVGESRRTSAFSHSQFDYDENDRMTGLQHLSYLGGIDPSVLVSLGYGYDAEGNREFTENYLATDRGEAYGHDNRNRLVMMSRGLLSTNAAGEVVVETADLLNHPTMVGRQDWVNLDRRGNWRDFRDTVAGNPARRETRNVNGANEYPSIDPDEPLPDEQGQVPANRNPLTSKYDAAGNVTHYPLAANVGETCTTPTPSDCRITQLSTTCTTDLLVKSGCGFGQDFVYDPANRVTAIHRDRNDLAGPFTGSTAEPKLMEFVYDALGRRVETVEYVNPATGQRTDGVGANPAPRKTRHVYFGLEVIQEYECGGAASVGSCTSAPLLVRDFVHGDPQRHPEVVAMQTYTINFPNPEDPPVSVPSAAYHYLHDVLGSVIGLVNDAGELVEQYTYDPYGKVFIEKWDAAANGGNGAWVASETDCGSSTCGRLPVSSFGNPFMWTGHRYDAAVGLNATHYRTYSPTLGRWLQRDPIEYEAGSVNLYEYVLSAPLMFQDALGLDRYYKRTWGHSYVGFDQYDKDGNKTGKIDWYDFAPPGWGGRGGSRIGGIWRVCYSVVTKAPGQIRGPKVGPGDDWDCKKKSDRDEDLATISRICNQSKSPPPFVLHGAGAGQNCIGWARCYFDDTPTPRKEEPRHKLPLLIPNPYHLEPQPQ